MDQNTSDTTMNDQPLALTNTEQDQKGSNEQTTTTSATLPANDLAKKVDSLNTNVAGYHTAVKQVIEAIKIQSKESTENTQTLYTHAQQLQTHTTALSNQHTILESHKATIADMAAEITSLKLTQERLENQIKEQNETQAILVGILQSLQQQVSALQKNNTSENTQPTTTMTTTTMGLEETTDQNDMTLINPSDLSLSAQNVAAITAIAEKVGSAPSLTSTSNAIREEWKEQLVTLNSDIQQWIQFLYDHEVQIVDYINAFVNTSKTEYRRLEDWVNYVETQLSVEHEFINQAQQSRKSKRSNYLTYFQWIEMREQYPEHYAKPPTYDNAALDAAKQLQQLTQKREDDLRDRQHHLAILQQRKRHIEDERKITAELNELTQRQLLIAKEQQIHALPQPLTVKAGMPLQLRTTQTPNEPLVEMNKLIHNMQEGTVYENVEHYLMQQQKQQLELIARGAQAAIENAAPNNGSITTNDMMG